MTDANPSTAAENAAEQYIAAAIDRGSGCARRLGKYLADHLDDDNFGPADRMLLGLVEQMNAAVERAEKAEADVARLREALAAIVARSETGELGTSRTRDMAHLARAALAETADTPAVQPDPTPDPDGWIKWGGGECPAPDGAWADVEFRNGIAYCTSNPSGLEWAHEGNEVDIVAYRIVEARDE